MKCLVLRSATLCLQCLETNWCLKRGQNLFSQFKCIARSHFNYYFAEYFHLFMLCNASLCIYIYIYKLLYIYIRNYWYLKDLKVKDVFKKLQLQRFTETAISKVKTPLFIKLLLCCLSVTTLTSCGQSLKLPYWIQPGRYVHCQKFWVICVTVVKKTEDAWGALTTLKFKLVARGMNSACFFWSCLDEFKEQALRADNFLLFRAHLAKMD